MTTTDDSKAALAAALHGLADSNGGELWDAHGQDGESPIGECQDWAADILAVLDGWTLVPSETAKRDMAEALRQNGYAIDFVRRAEANEAEITLLRAALTAIANHPLCDEGCWRDMARGAIRLDDIHGTPTFSE